MPDHRPSLLLEFWMLLGLTDRLFYCKFNKAVSCVASRNKALSPAFLLHASYVTKPGKLFLELTVVHSGL